MKNFFVASTLVSLMLFGSIGQAQTTASASPTDAEIFQRTPQIERARINAERSQIEIELSNAEVACYNTFFVNNCVEKVRNRRYEVLGDLKRQEVILNTQERRAKGAEQIRKTEEKSSPEKLQQDLDKRTAAVAELQSRVDGDKQKAADRAAAQASEQANREAAALRLRNNQEKAVARTARQADATEAVNQANERQRQAIERRARYEREKLERTKPLSKPLPVPP